MMNSRKNSSKNWMKNCIRHLLDTHRIDWLQQQWRQREIVVWLGWEPNRLPMHSWQLLDTVIHKRMIVAHYR